MKANRSEFAEALRGLLDKTGLFNRRGWAELLGVSEVAISQWVNDKTIPRFDCLMIIYDLLRSREVPSQLLDEFERVANADPNVVSPHGERMVPSIWEYMHKSPYPSNVLETHSQTSVRDRSRARKAEPSIARIGISLVEPPRSDHREDWGAPKCSRDGEGRDCQAHELGRFRTAAYINRRLRLDRDDSAEEQSRDDSNGLPSGRRILLLGNAGSGKSNYMCHMLNQLRDRSDEREARVFFVHAPCIPKVRSQREFGIVFGGDEEGSPAGDTTVLIDGFDEVDSEYRAPFGRLLAEFAERNRRFSVIVSSRHAEGLGELSGFTRYELEPFTAQNIAQWVNTALSTRWPIALNKSQFEVTRFLSGLSESPDFQQTIGRPLFLRAVTELFARNGVTSGFESDVLQECISVLVDKWDREKCRVRVSEPWARPQKLTKMLSTIAFHSLDYQEATFDSALAARWLDPVEWRIPAHSIVNLLAEQTGLIDQTEGQCWKFRDPTMQRFLAARYLVESNQDMAALLGRDHLAPHADTLLKFVCALTTDATPVVSAVLMWCEQGNETGFQFLSCILEEDSACRIPVIRHGCEMLAGWLDDAFEGFEICSLKGPFVDQGPVWRIDAVNRGSRIMHSKRGHQVRRVLRSLHKARTGCFREEIRSSLGRGKSEIVKQFASSLDFDGRYSDEVLDDAEFETISASVKAVG